MSEKVGDERLRYSPGNVGCWGGYPLCVAQAKVGEFRTATTRKLEVARFGGESVRFIQEDTN